MGNACNARALIRSDKANKRYFFYLALLLPLLLARNRMHLREKSSSRNPELH